MSQELLDVHQLVQGPLRDADIRRALVPFLATRLGDRRHVLVPEVDIRWTVPARLDAMLVADRITGIEIKSDADSLTRLPRQVEAYGAVVERAMLVVGERHRVAATELVPPWWSVWSARRRGGCVQLRQVRGGRLNPEVNPLAITTFMSRQDLSAVLRLRGHQRLSGLPVDELRDHLLASVGSRGAVRAARAAMLGRHDWRRRSLSAR